MGDRKAAALIEGARGHVGGAGADGPVLGVAHVGDSADEPPVAAGAQEGLAARPQLVRGLALRRQLVGADQLGLDRVARPLQGDERLDRRVVREVKPVDPLALP